MKAKPVLWQLLHSYGTQATNRAGNREGHKKTPSPSWLTRVEIKGHR